MRLLIAAAWLTLASAACAPARRAVDFATALTESPPGTVRLPSGLFVDRTEVDNIGYKEYLVWTRRIFGPDSEAYAAALPDTSVWSAIGLDADYGGVYFWDRTYDLHPVVGVSHRQAKDFCRWRTDRVAELLLIRLGLLEFVPRTDSTYFTLDAYAAGTYPLLGSALPLDVPFYRLPTDGDWSYLSGASAAPPYGVDVEARENRRLDGRRSGSPFNTQEKLSRRMGEKVLDAATLPAAETPTNVFGLRATVGNVREMTSVPGRVRGGSYIDTLGPELVARVGVVDGPDAFTGFRCVAQVRRVAYGR